MARDLVPVTERMFGNLHDDRSIYDGDDGGMDYASQVRAMIDDARDFEEQMRAPKRELFIRYYEGLEPELEDEGRSTIVATEARDTVLSILPSLMRIFTAHENVCEFIPTTPDMVAKAEEAIVYVNWVFMEDNPGFLSLYGVFKDALIKSEGILTWWTEQNDVRKTHTYKGITEEQFQFLVSECAADPEKYQITRHENFLGNGPDGPAKLYNCILVCKKKENVHRVEAIPPDEFRIDRLAKSVKTAQLVGRERVVTVSDLVELGLDEEEVEEHAGASMFSAGWTAEKSLRNEGLELGFNNAGSQNEGVLYGEYYIRIDQDGDGIAELRKICTIGDTHDIVFDEEVDAAKFAYFCADPEPHTALGHGIVELVMDLQKIKSNLLRSGLDSIASTIFPRHVVVENMVNMDDVLNTETGAPIRARSIEAVKQLEQTFIGDAPMQMMAYLDQIRQQRTGISEASKGLDPKALQSTTMKGVDMVVTGAQERIELIARILAETGMKDTFRGLLREVSDNPNYERTIKVAGKWVPIRPDYDPAMGVRVNPSLGRGSDMDKMLVLTQVIAKQEMIMQTLGPDNPLCSPVEWRNAMQDLLSLGGMKNMERFFKAVTPDDVKAMSDNAQQAKQMDPGFILASNEREKLRLAAVKHVNDDDFRHTKLETDDNFRRDKLEVDSTLKGASEGMRHIAQANQQENQQAHEQATQMAEHNHASENNLLGIQSDHIKQSTQMAYDTMHKVKDHAHEASQQQATIDQGDRHKSIDAHLQRQSLEDKVTTAKETNDTRREIGTQPKSGKPARKQAPK